MNAIHIRKKLESDTLHLPELRPWLGKTVEIIVLEDTGVSGVKPGTGDWDAYTRAAAAITDYDFDAVRKQDEVDIQDAAHKKLVTQPEVSR